MKHRTPFKPITGTYTRVYRGNHSQRIVYKLHVKGSMYRTWRAKWENVGPWLAQSRYSQWRKLWLQNHDDRMSDVSQWGMNR